MKKVLIFSLFVVLAFAFVFTAAPIIGTGPPDLNDSGIYALNQMSDLAIFTTVTGGSGGTNSPLLATATPMDVPFLKNESYTTLTARPDSAAFYGASYIESPPTKSPWIIAPVISNRPGYPLRT